MSEQPAPRRSPRLIRSVALLVAGCAVLGVAVGFVWALIAPRTQLVAQKGELLYAQVTEGAAGGVLSLGCLLAACGVVTGIVVARWQKVIGVGLLLGVLASGLLGSAVAGWVGLQVANGADNGVELSAAGRQEGVTFSGPLVLDAPGVLGLWSLFALVVLWVVLWRRARAARKRVDDIVRQAQGVDLAQR